MDGALAAYRRIYQRMLDEEIRAVASGDPAKEDDLP